MSSPVHYAAFECSRELREMGEHLGLEVEQGSWRQFDTLIDIVALFQKESSERMVVESVAAMGGSAEVIAGVRKNGASLNGAIVKIAKQVVPKLNQTQMTVAKDHLKGVTLLIDQPDASFRHYIGFRGPDSLHAKRAHVANLVHSGRNPTPHAELTALLNQLVDEWIDNFYLRVVQDMKVGFIATTLVQGGVALARGLQHQAVKRAIPRLGADGVAQAVAHFERMTLTLPAVPAFRYVYKGVPEPA